MALIKKPETSLEFNPPGYRITKICKNCAYYRPLDSNMRASWHGFCFLEREIKPNAPVRPTHGMCVCDAHIYKNVERNINRLSAKYGVAIPEESAL
jgi:hypothetical protein